VFPLAKFSAITLALFRLPSLPWSKETILYVAKASKGSFTLRSKLVHFKAQKNIFYIQETLAYSSFCLV